jgi:hypothetical protein
VSNRALDMAFGTRKGIFMATITITLHNVGRFGFRADPPSEQAGPGDDVVFRLTGAFAAGALYFPDVASVFVDQATNTPPASDLIPFPNNGTITLTVIAVPDAGTHQYAAFRRRNVQGGPVAVVERRLAEGNSPPEIIIP